jgi:hypothetical protein
MRPAVPIGKQLILEEMHGSGKGADETVPRPGVPLSRSPDQSSVVSAHIRRIALNRREFC